MKPLRLCPEVSCKSVADVWKEQLCSLGIFDAGAWLGKTSIYPLMEEGTPGLIKKLQTKYNIKNSLVSLWNNGEWSVSEGNLYLMEKIKRHENWFGVITGTPLNQYAPDSLIKFEKLLHDNKVRGARLFPSSLSYNLDRWCIGDLCAMLDERRVPVFIFQTEASFPEIFELAMAFPKLDIILETQIKKIIYHIQTLVPLLKKCKNVHIDISNITTPGLLEYFINVIGSERLVLSTFMPANDPMLPIGMLLKDTISYKDKNAIAGDNIRRIISGKK